MAVRLAHIHKVECKGCRKAYPPPLHARSPPKRSFQLVASGKRCLCGAVFCDRCLSSWEISNRAASPFRRVKAALSSLRSRLSTARCSNGSRAERVALDEKLHSQKRDKAPQAGRKPKSPHPTLQSNSCCHKLVMQAAFQQLPSYLEHPRLRTSWGTNLIYLFWRKECLSANEHILVCKV